MGISKEEPDKRNYKKGEEKFTQDIKRLRAKLKRKQSETTEDYIKRKEEYYCSLHKSKDEYIKAKNLILTLNKTEESLDDLKDHVLLIKHSPSSYPKYSFQKELEDKLQELKSFDFQMQEEMINYNDEFYGIESDLKTYKYFKLLKIQHYKKIEYLEKELKSIKKNKKESIASTYCKFSNKYSIEAAKEKLREDGSKNLFYYQHQIKDVVNQKNIDTQSIRGLGKRHELLKRFNHKLYKVIGHNIFKIHCLSWEIANLNEETIEYNNKDFRIKVFEQRVIEAINFLMEFSTVIRKNIESNEFEIALKLKEYILTTLNDFNLYFKNWFKIDVQHNKIKLAFDEFKKTIQESVNIDNIRLMRELSYQNSNHLSKQLSHFPEYCKVGALFAQGKVTQKKFTYFYEDEEFDSINKLSKHLQKNTLQKVKSIRQYINDTLSENGEKNFYTSKTKMRKIIDYCTENNIKITAQFLSRYNELNNLH